MDNSWFKLLLRAIGVYIGIMAGTSLVDYAIRVAQLYMNASQFGGAGGYTSSDFFMMYAPGAAVVVVQLAFAIYLICGAPAFVRWCLKHAVGHCPNCDYDMKELNQDKCPECGTAVFRRVATSPVDAATP